MTVKYSAFSSLAGVEGTALSATRNTNVGDWSAIANGIILNIGDIVQYNGSSYYVKNSFTKGAGTAAPDANTDFRIYASVGASAINNATVFLYRRSVGVPPKPTVVGTYTFKPIPNLTIADPNWTKTVPAGINPLYVVTATASSDTSTDNDIAINEWSEPIIMSENGINVSPVFLYQRFTSVPARPTGTTRFTFATSVLTTITGTNNWSQTVPTANGMPLYVTTASAASAGPTDDIAFDEWALPTILAQDGANAISGFLTNESHTVSTLNDGTGGVYGAAAGGNFKVFNGTTPVTTGVSYGFNSPSQVGIFSISASGDYSVTEPTGDNATVNFTAEFGGVTITKVYSISKSKGGGAGQSVAEVTAYRRDTVVPALPTNGTYNFTTKVLTAPTTPVVWSSTIPSGTDPLYAATGTASVTGTTGTANVSWVGVGKLAENGGKGNPGADGAGVDVIFIRSATQPGTPAASIATPTNWFSSIASVPAGNDPIWASFGQRADSVSNYVWDVPARHTGAGGPVIALTSDAQAFKYVDNVRTPDAQTITLKAIRQNTTETVTWVTSPAGLVLGSTADTMERTLTIANFGANRQVTITVTGDTTGVKDTITLVRLDQTSNNALSFVPRKTWNFLTTAEGWTSALTTITATNGILSLGAQSNDPQFFSPTLNVNGANHYIIRARIRATQPNVDWDGNIYYNTASHGYTASFYKNAPKPVGWATSEWCEVEWDMRNLTVGGNSFTLNNIISIRMDFNQTASNNIEVDWVTIGDVSVDVVTARGIEDGATYGAPGTSPVGTTTGTLIQQQSQASTDAIVAISSDSVLSKGEKGPLIREWLSIDREYPSIRNQGIAFSVSTLAYENARNALDAYLNTLSPVWSDTTQNTTVVTADFNLKFNDYYAAKSALLTAIDAKGGTIATWVGVTGTGRPSDFAGVTLTFTALPGGVVQGNQVTSIAGNSWNTGAYSNETQVGSAYLFAKPFTIASSEAMIGLCDTVLTTGQNNYIELDYAFYAVTGNLHIYESGALAMSLGAITTSTALEIVYNIDKIKYYVDGYLVREVAATPIGGGQAANRIFRATVTQNGGAEAGFKNIQFRPYYPLPSAISFNALPNAEVLGNRVISTPRMSGGWVSGATSSEIYFGTAVVSAKANKTSDIAAMIGLITPDPLTAASNNYAQIDYALYASNGTLFVYENGGGAYNMGAYNTSQNLSVVYDGVTIKYYADAVLLRTVTGVAANLGMRAAVALGGGHQAGFDDISFGPFTQNNWSAVGGTGRPADNATMNRDGANMIPDPVNLTRIELGAGATKVSGPGTNRPAFDGNGVELASVTNALVVWEGSVTAMPCLPNETLYMSHAATHSGGNPTTDKVELRIQFFNGVGTYLVEYAVPGTDISGNDLNLERPLTKRGSYVVPSNASYVRIYSLRIGTAQSGWIKVAEPYLGRAEQGADITSGITGESNIDVQYTYQNVAKDGQLPREGQYKLFRNGVQVTSGIAWSVALVTGTASATMSGAGTGILNISSVTASAVLRVKAIHQGATRLFDVTVNRLVDAAPPPVGGGTVVSFPSITSSSTTGYGAANTSTVTVKTGPSGILRYSLSSEFYMSGNAPGSSAAYGTFYVRLPGGSFGPGHTEQPSQANAEVFSNSEPGTPTYYDRYPGSISFSIDQTGLAGGQDYEVYLDIRNSAARTLNFDGSASVTGL